MAQGGASQPTPPQISKELYLPGTHLAVDEAITRFTGRDYHIVNLPGKPIPEGYKIWCLAESGYVINWLFHTILKQIGPVDLDKPLYARVEQRSEHCRPKSTVIPNQQPIYLDDGSIGKGQFGEVRKVIKLRDGQCYAAKNFFRPQGLKSAKKRKRDEDDWLQKIRDEIDIMDRNPHLNIMRVLGILNTPEPVLLMPYYPMGNLGDLQDVSDEKYLCAFHQMLLGLSHLHGRGVAHRDLKPENFLVSEHPFTIIIADFGLSKAAINTLLTTFCGTMKYAAPEIFSSASGSYGLSVDIWSIGVVMLEFMYGLPELPPYRAHPGIATLQHWSQIWSQRLLKRLDESDENNDMVVDILLRMIRIDPERKILGR